MIQDLEDSDDPFSRDLKEEFKRNQSFQSFRSVDHLCSSVTNATTSGGTQNESFQADIEQEIELVGTNSCRSTEPLCQESSADENQNPAVGSTGHDCNRIGTIEETVIDEN